MKTKDQTEIPNIEKAYKLVQLEWVDAESDSTWDTKDKITVWADKDCVIYEIGWLVAETKKYIVISNQITYDGDIGNRTKIPRKWIRKREVVTVRKT